MKKLKYLLFLIIIFISSNVFADSFNKVEVAYGYDRGSSTGIWSGYSTTLSHNFGNTDATRGYINTLNNIFTLNNQFQNGNFYSVNFNLQNDYTSYSSSFTLYDALQEMGHFNLKCSTSSSGSFLESEQCFTNYNVRFQKTAYDEVKAIISFTPLTNFTRLLLNITRDGSPTGSQLISEYFAFSNFSYTMSTGGTGEIIDNQNENTQQIIDNQNENTQELINNINENFNGCFNYDSTYSRTRNPYYNNIGYLNSDGSITSSNLFRYTYYLIVSMDKTYFIHRNNNDILNQYYCLYDTNKTLISCTSMGSSTTTNFAPTQDGFVRISYSIDGNNSLQFTGQYCTSKFNELNEDVLSSAGTISDSIQQQIDSQKVCKLIDKSNIVLDNSLLNTLTNGGTSINPVYGITDYISINSNSNIKVMKAFNLSASTSALCFYNINKTLISCVGNNTLTTVDYQIPIPANSSFVRFSIQKTDNKPTFQVCTDGNQAMNDYLTDDTDPNVDDNAINDVFGRVHFVDPLSYLLTLPTQLINQIVSMSDTCSTIDLGTLYGVHLTLPCINLENYLGSDLWSILDIILSVGLLSVILKNFYDTISNLLTLGGEKEAKEKFSMPTPMDFLAMILGGDNK